MANKDKKPIEIEDSRLMTKRIIREEVNSEGKRVLHTRWFIEERPLELGSCKNPKNEDVLDIKFEVAQDMGRNPLGGFFNMFK